MAEEESNQISDNMDSLWISDYTEIVYCWHPADVLWSFMPQML